MVETFYKIYKITDDILLRGFDMSKLKCCIPFHAKISKDNVFYLFIYEILDEISERGRLGDDTWTEMDRSDAFKFKKFQELNSKIWENMDSSSKDISKFTNLYRMYKELFINSEEPEIRDNVRSFIDDIEKYLGHYYSPLFDDFLNKIYGLGIDGSICLYFATDDYVEIKNLPPEIQENILDLKKNVINGKEYLDGCYAFVFKKNKSKSFELGLKRVKDFENIKEIICDDEWQLGIPTVIPSMFPGPNMYEILPHVYLTDINGKRLLGRFTFKNGQLIDNKRLWWQDNELLERNFLFRYDGRKYGIETVFFITTRFGYTNRIMRFIVHLESHELKLGLL